jgi:hypothetical protein
MSASGRRTVVTVIATALVVALVTACGALGRTEGRGPVSLAGRGVDVIEGDTLLLTVPSCYGNPELTSLTQDDQAVTVEIVTTVGDQPDCADGLRVELDEPLGNRRVIDATSGEALRITAR